MRFHVFEARAPGCHPRSTPARIQHRADCAGSRSGEGSALNANAGSAPGPARRLPRQWRRHDAPDLGGVPAAHREAERWFGEGEMRSGEPARGSSLPGATAPVIAPWQYLPHPGNPPHRGDQTPGQAFGRTAPPSAWSRRSGRVVRYRCVSLVPSPCAQPVRARFANAWSCHPSGPAARLPPRFEDQTFRRREPSALCDPVARLFCGRLGAREVRLVGARPGFLPLL